MKKLLALFLLLLLTGCKEEFLIETYLNPGYDIISLNESWIDEGCNLVINENEFLEMAVFNDIIDTSYIEEHEVNYRISYEGQEYTCKRIVKVIDDIAPTISLNPGMDTITQGTIWIDASVTFSDNYDDDLTLEVIGSVDVNEIGIYFVTYTVTDQSNNSTSKTRVITVIE